MTEEPEIHKYIPQRPPFVMVDSIERAAETQVWTLFRIRADNVLLEHGCLSEAGLLENIAQSAAAGTGAIAARQGLPPQIGFIGAVKNLAIYHRPKSGTSVRTEITFGQTIGNAGLVEGLVFSGAELCARASLTIFLQ